MTRSEDKRKSILDAAITQFSQYGFRKTSMEDLANAAGVSRPSLYSYFDNKEEIFRGLSQHLNETAFADAQNALTGNRGKMPIADRVQLAFQCFSVSLFRLLDESPHGAELMDENSRLCGDVAQDFYAAFEALLAEEITYAEEQSEISLTDAAISPAQAAEIIRLGSLGLKSGAADAAHYQNRLNHFIRIYFSGL